MNLFKIKFVFLGLQVGKEDIRVNPDKFEILRTLPKKYSVTNLQRFLALLQLFQGSVLVLKKCASPLTDMTKKGSCVHKWDSNCVNSFQKLIESITSAPFLFETDWKRPFRGHINASNTAVGVTVTNI